MTKKWIEYRMKDLEERGKLASGEELEKLRSLYRWHKEQLSKLENPTAEPKQIDAF